MDIHRIDGIKYNFETLDTAELERIQSYLVVQHGRIVEDMTLIGGELFKRSHVEAPVDTGEQNYEHVLGRAVMAGEIDASVAYGALEGYRG